MISLNIHPLFVFDGPNKPPFKRNKRTSPNVASIPEFLAKQLLKSFGFPLHVAPGEAEAECALLQREGVVDAVLSEDVDTLMFGSKVTIRNWSAQDKGKTPTHVNLYDAHETKQASGLDREGMILVALMSGGDYVPQGIPGCGPKIACEAARAGFGHDLCKIRKNDKAGLKEWRERLSHELKTNESKFFKSKHGALKIPEDFPSPEILGYYTHPAISTLERVQDLQERMTWDRDLDFQELRSFTGDAFDWRNFSGAKKFVRNLAQSLIIRELRLGAQSKRSGLVQGIHAIRTHTSTDGLPELRISYIPIDTVNIDLDAEPPDDEIQVEEVDDEVEFDNEDLIEPSTQTAKSRPYLYDPTQLEKIWIPQVYVKVGEPEKYAEWELRLNKAPGSQSVRASAPKNSRGYKTKSKEIDRNMRKGALESLVQVGKPTGSASQNGSNPQSSQTSKINEHQAFRAQPFRVPPPRPLTPPQETISLLSSSPVQATQSRVDLTPTKNCDALGLPSTITTKRRKRSPLRRALTAANDLSIDNLLDQAQPTESPNTSTSVLTTAENTPKRPKNRVRNGKKKAPQVTMPHNTDIFSSPSKSSIVYYFSPQWRQNSGHADAPGVTNSITCLDLTMSSPCRAQSRPRMSKSQGTTQLSSLSDEAETSNEDEHDLSGILSKEGASGADDSPKLSSPTEQHIATLDLTMSSPDKRHSITKSRNDRIVPPLKSRQQSNDTILNVECISSPPVRRSPRLNKSKEVTSPPPRLSNGKRARQSFRVPLAPTNPQKQWIRVRKSLAGSFSVEERVSPQNNQKSHGMWKMSDIKVLDLT